MPPPPFQKHHDPEFYLEKQEERVSQREVTTVCIRHKQGCVLYVWKKDLQQRELHSVPCTNYARHICIMALILAYFSLLLLICIMCSSFASHGQQSGPMQGTTIQFKGCLCNHINEKLPASEFFSPNTTVCACSIFAWHCGMHIALNTRETCILFAVQREQHTEALVTCSRDWQSIRSSYHMLKHMYKLNRVYEHMWWYKCFINDIKTADIAEDIKTVRQRAWTFLHSEPCEPMFCCQYCLLQFSRSRKESCLNRPHAQWDRKSCVQRMIT